MQEYEIIIAILTEVFAGKNLAASFAGKVENLQAGTNIGKIKDVSYGVCRHYYQLKILIDQLVTKTTLPIVRVLLLIAFYEINFTQKPAYAVTNDIVNLSAKYSKDVRAKNFVNAVIRNYLRKKQDILKVATANLEYQLNFPKWWLERLAKSLAADNQSANYEEALAVLENLNLLPRLNLRVNPRKITKDGYTKMLGEAGIDYEEIEETISLIDTVAVSKLPYFTEGYVSIQDINAQKLVDLIAPLPHSYILDACCAPGGKLCQLLENYDCEALGLDIDANRLAKVRQNLQRLELNAQLVEGDATSLKWWDSRLFDVVIADVPCSASGTVRRNPDIKIMRQEADIAKFVALQRQIVKNLWQVVKPGGKLVYITCSIFRAENQENIAFMQNSCDDCVVLEERQLLPTAHADGLFYAVLEKVYLQTMSVPL